ncbi:hypothetical protein D049_2366A, partial [Vibrio parahaemolyticus VPTS-2010]
MLPPFAESTVLPLGI